MAGYSFGNLFQLTTFGESHGEAIGGVIGGCPAGINLDFDKIQQELNRRKPGQSNIVTQRKEADEVKFLSGIFDGITTGSPIGFLIENQNQKSKDYSHLKDVYRPSHADFTYQKKYGHRDYRGGGRSSARETANWIVGGAVAKQIIPQVQIVAYTNSVGEMVLNENNHKLNFSEIEKNPVRVPNAEVALEMQNFIKKVRSKGDTVGGTIKCSIKNVPVGLGEPIFDKLHAQLAKAMMSINAVKGFEYGSGFEGAKMRGSEHNDLFYENQKTKTNNSGGIQGGISNGMEIYFKVAFKPVATLMQSQEALNKNGELVEMQAKGRHDPCVVPRAVPIVEAMAAMVLTDFFLIQKTNKI